MQIFSCGQALEKPCYSKNLVGFRMSKKVALKIRELKHHMVSNSLVVAHKKGLRVSFFLTYCWQLG